MISIESFCSRLRISHILESVFKLILSVRWNSQPNTVCYEHYKSNCSQSIAWLICMLVIVCVILHARSITLWTDAFIELSKLACSNLNVLMHFILLLQYNTGFEDVFHGKI